MTKTKNILINLGILVLVIAAFIGYLSYTGRLGAVSAQIQRVDKFWLLGGFVALFAYLAFEMLALDQTLKIAHIKVDKPRLVSTTMLGIFFGNLTPSTSGAQPAQAASLALGGVPIGRTASVLLSKFIIFQAVVTVFAAIMLVFNIGFFRAAYGNIALLAIVGFVVHFFVLIGLVAAGLFPKWISKLGNAILNLAKKFKLIKRMGNKRQRLEDEVQKFASSFKELQHHKVKLVVIAIITGLELLCLYSVPYFVIMSMGITDVNYFNILAATAFVNLIATSVPLPGGSGGAEGAFILFFGHFVGKGNPAMSAMILWRFITFYFPTIIAAPFITQLKPKKPLQGFEKRKHKVLKRIKK